MTKVIVHSGICGFSVAITAEKGQAKTITISLDTDCEMVSKMRDDISALDLMAAFTRQVQNPVYRSASQHIKHAACPVPAAILKALEVEAGLALPKDVTIKFQKD